MTTPNRAWFTLLTLVAVAFAGCTDGGPAADDCERATDDCEATLQSGKGAIAGLLVDDRFRPIHLTDDPTSEFQAEGFVLLQETGQQAQTNENGEFTFTDLDPGTYTLRVDAAGHEASPKSVDVRAGEFAETTVIARRALDAGSTILTQEHVVFIACSATLLVALNFNECGVDGSGDSDRSSFDTDYTDIEDVTYLVTEMKANQEARYELDVWYVPDELTEDAEFYANSVFTGDYIKMVLQKGETNHDNEDLFENDPWNNTYPFQTDLLVYGELAEEGSAVDPFFLGGGVGVQLATKARFMHSLFIGEPEVDVNGYCLLCE